RFNVLFAARMGAEAATVMVSRSVLYRSFLPPMRYCLPRLSTRIAMSLIALCSYLNLYGRCSRFSSFGRCGSLLSLAPGGLRRGSFCLFCKTFLHFYRHWRFFYNTCVDLRNFCRFWCYDVFFLAHPGLDLLALIVNVRA